MKMRVGRALSADFRGDCPRSRVQNQPRNAAAGFLEADNIAGRRLDDKQAICRRNESILPVLVKIDPPVAVLQGSVEKSSFDAHSELISAVEVVGTEVSRQLVIRWLGPDWS